MKRIEMRCKVKKDKESQIRVPRRRVSPSKKSKSSDVKIHTNYLQIMLQQSYEDEKRDDQDLVLAPKKRAVSAEITSNSHYFSQLQ